MEMIAPFAYLGALLVSTACMALLDHRFRLVFWRPAAGRSERSRAARRSALRGAAALGIGVGFFLLWDLAAIASGHYHAGQSAGMTGLMLAPELPVEEIVFITFLSYLTLVLRGLVVQVLDRVRDRPRTVGTP